MSNFRFIEENINVDKVLGEVLDNPHDWGAVTKIKNIAGDLKPYGFLPLTMAVVKNRVMTLMILNYKQIHRCSTNIKKFGNG